MKKDLMISVLTFLVLGSTQAMAGGGSSIGPDNPASYHCLELGGSLESVNSPQGQYANCVIEEWQLFRKMQEQGLVLDHNYGPGVGFPNPASVNCEDIGGALRSIESPLGQSAMCIVEEWALWRVFHPIN